MRKTLLTVVAVVLGAGVVVATAAVFAPRSGEGAGFYLGDNEAKAVKLIAKLYGVSELAGKQIMRKQARAGGWRTIDRLELPHGALVDFISVDGTAPLGKQVKLLGQAKVLSASSHEGIAFWNALTRLAIAKPDLRGVARWESEIGRKRGFYLAPAWWGGGTSLASVAGRIGRLVLGQGAAEVRRVAVVCVELPGWFDACPQGDGDSNQNNDPYCYHPYQGGLSVEDGGLRNVSGNSPVTDTDIDWYLDSPGGPMPTDGGRPIGLNFPTTTYARRDWGRSNPIIGELEMQVKGYWGPRMFSAHFTGGSGPWPEWSLREYYWANSHGHIDFQGTENDVYGWVRSRHVLDRWKYPYQCTAGALASGQPWNDCYFMIQPGTPLIRPTHNIPASPGIMDADGIPAGARILRASLGVYGSTTKLTILFANEVYSIGTIHLYAEQQDVLAADNDALTPGWCHIVLPGDSSEVIRDPYDARRWTIINNGWTFTSADPDPDDQDDMDFAVWNGHRWGIVWNGYQWGFIEPTAPADGSRVGGAGVAPDGWQLSVLPGRAGYNPSTPYAPQNQGCGPLPYTLLSIADVLGQGFRDSDNDGAPNRCDPSAREAVDSNADWDTYRNQVCQETHTTLRQSNDWKGNRLFCMEYYTHYHVPAFASDSAPYQLKHTWHGSYVDDIAGESEGAHFDRPCPFDLSPDDVYTGGLSVTLPGALDAVVIKAGHSDMDFVQDVLAAMKDNGYDFDETRYDHVIWLFAGPGPTEQGGVQDPNSGGGAFIAHATLGGKYVWVPENVNLYTMAHEVGHNLGLVDLYDCDMYNNHGFGSGLPPNPPFFECWALGPYSLMAHGARVDAWSAAVRKNWVPLVELTDDHPNAQIPAVEGTLRDPVVLKLYANPYALIQKLAGINGTDEQKEYYLIENRARTGNDYFGDQAYPGLYIYHVDERVGGPPKHMNEIEGLQTVGLVEADNGWELQTTAVTSQLTGLEGDAFGRHNHNFGWRTSPPAKTHGKIDSYDVGGFTRYRTVPDTEEDSFVRVLNISSPGDTVTADIYVRPREIIAEAQSLMPDVDGDGNPGPLWQGMPWPLDQPGKHDVPVMAIKLKNPENQTTPGDPDYKNMSFGPVTISTLAVQECGTSSRGADIAVAKLWASTDNVFDDNDTLLATTTVTDDNPPSELNQAIFTGLNYEVPLHDPNDPNDCNWLIVTYEIAQTAQINPRITVGAQLPDATSFDFVQPGSVQEYERLDQPWGVDRNKPRFPTPADPSTAPVLEGTDTLYISSSSLAPTEVHPNDTDVLVLRMVLSVDHDHAIVRRLRFICKPDPAHGPSNAQHDVSKAVLWRDDNQDGQVDPNDDTKLGEAVFSTGQVLLFDGLDLTVNAGDNVHLLVTFDIAEDATLGNWLELQVPTWFEDNGTPADPSDDVYYVSLVDEDGSNNTLYQNPADPTDVRDVAHGADPATWKIVAGQDVVDTSGAPWKSNDFVIAPPTKPVLSDATITPLHGDKSDVFTLTVTYTSDAGIMPDFVRLVYRNVNWDAADPNQVLDMHEADPGDTNVKDGKLYQIQITGLPDWGTYKHYFWTSDGYSEVFYYDPEGPNSGDPEGTYDTAPRQADVNPTLDDWLPGPIIGVPSTVRFADAAWNDTDQYEEGRETEIATAAKVYIEVTDPDENEDPATAETVTVTVSCAGAGGDSESGVVLTETGPDTGVFRGTLPTIGRAGANDDGWLNAIAGSSGQQITVVYKDKDDNPQPGAVDTSQDQATVVDTTPPDPVAPVTATSGPQGRKISVDWSGYDEAAQIDVAQYRVYCETTDFNNVAGLTPVAALPAGTQTYEITGLEPDTDYYIAITPLDEVPNENTNVVTTHVKTTDTEPPSLLSQDPADGATGIALSARTVTAQVQDIGTGIDINDANAVQVTVTADDGSGARNVAGNLTVSGGGAAGLDPVDIAWTANEDWHWNDVVTVDLKVKDRAGNELHVTWSFSVYTDHTPPAFVNNTPTPEPDAEQVPLDTPIIVEIQDGADAGMPASNLDLATLNFEVTVTNGGNQTFHQVFTNADSDPNGPFTVTVIDAGHITIRYAPAGGWAWNDEVAVHVVIADNAGNQLDEQWSFKVYTDHQPPVFVAGTPTPGDGADNQPLDSQIVAEIQDQGDPGVPPSNLNLASLTFEVTVTNQGNQTFHQVFTNADSDPNGPFTVNVIDAGHIRITYAHPGGWTWNDVVTVRVVIADNAGNVLDYEWTFNALRDENPPFVEARSPDADEHQVALDAPIVITMADDVSGVDAGTVQVEIQVTNRGNVRIPWTDITQDQNFTSSWSADFCHGTLRYQPAGGWLYNDVVSVRVRAADRVGNQMPDWDQWTFYVLEDTDDLAIVDLDPDDGATDVPRNTNITFRVVDAVSGVDRDSISLRVNGVDIPQDQLTITGDLHDYHVSYDPPQDFDYGQVVQCHAEARDIAGNETSRDWSFTTEGDLNPPTITPISPLADATDVPIGTTISVRISDAETGVDPTTVAITVTADGNAIGGNLTVTQDNGSVTAVFDPAADLPYETQINVHVEARDNGVPAPNLGTLDYSFTTELAPRYTIIGRVTDAGGAPIAAVTIELTGDANATALTDGNGFYQFRGLLAGNYTLTPVKDGYEFTPAQRVLALADDVDNADFVGREITYALSGQVIKNGQPLAGVTITVDGRQVVTGDDGQWRVDGLRPGRYTITPSLANHRFDPPSRSVRIVDADIGNLDFEAIPLAYSIAGLVTDSDGNRLEDVVITADGHRAITAENGRYQLGGIPAGTVEVRAEKQGWVFFWRDDSGQLHSGPRTVTVPPDQTAVDFIGYRAVRAAFSAGIHMIGVPAYPRDPSPLAVFGTQLVARWDPTAQPPGYVTPLTRPDSPFLRVLPGRGFFVRFDRDTDIEIAADPVPTDRPFNMALSPGWNMQANPFPGRLPFASFQVASGEMRPFGYVYDAVRGQYLLISAQPGIGVARSYLLPWEGIWLRAMTTVSLQVSPPTETVQAKPVESLQLDLGTDGWWVPIKAEAGERVDTCCAVGVSTKGTTVMLEKPPAMPNTVDVSVVSPTGTRLARAIDGRAQQTHTWDIVVRTDIPNTEVVLSLPDLSRVPHDVTLTLTDLDANKTVYVRTMAGYRFTVGPDGGTRRFKLTAAPRTSAGLVVASASARAAGSNVVVTYTVSAPCRVYAKVMNIAGRTVKVIASGNEVTAGVNSLAWDGRNAAGAPVPAGLYLIEIEGVAASGQRAKAVTQVRINPR